MLESLENKFDKTLKFLRGQSKIRASHIDQAIGEIKDTLLEADVQYDVVGQFLERVKSEALGSRVSQSLSPYEEFLKILYQEMLTLFGSPEPLKLSGKPPHVILMSGLQGAGKTTSSAKLAYFLKKKEKRKPLLVSVDVTRPAAIEQLERLAKDAGVDYFKSDSKVPLERAQAALKYAQTYGLDTLIVDTAGRLSIDEALMNELAELQRHLLPKEILYVADAMSGQQGLKVAEGFAQKIGISGVILSKSDGDTRGGIAFSIKASLGTPLRFMGVGEKIDGLEVFHPDRWLSKILGKGDIATLIEKVQSVAEDSPKPGRDEMKRLTSGNFTFLDFQEQMKMISKMGSIGGLMGMIPGMSQLAQKVNQVEVDKKLKKINAMIDSMTPLERRDPDLLNGDRRRRIARGSGTTVEELNQFVREFLDMQKMMKRFSGKGMKGLGNLFRGAS